VEALPLSSVLAVVVPLLPVSLDAPPLAGVLQEAALPSVLPLASVDPLASELAPPPNMLLSLSSLEEPPPPPPRKRLRPPNWRLDLLEAEVSAAGAESVQLASAPPPEELAPLSCFSMNSAPMD
jgi:hypothetical protein